MRKSLTAKAQTAGGLLFVLFLVVSGAYCSVVRVTNEIGPVGMDTSGRQILIQSLEAYLADDQVRVTSEWEDTNIVGRMIQEPMRTTMRFISEDPAAKADADGILAQPFTAFTGGMTEISMSRDRTLSRDEFDLRLRDLNVRTVGEMLAAMGFRRYEVWFGTSKISVELPQIGNGNTRFVGGDR
jgi:hypothetical protein